MRNNRKRIFKLLETSNGLTTSELSESLGISPTAIRRHLKSLEAQDLVRHRKEQRGIGRPSYVYEPTNSAFTGFPQSYAAFVESALQDLEGLDDDEKLLDLYRRRQRKRYKPHIAPTNGRALSDRVASLAQLLERDGRLSTWQRLSDGRYILRQHNCPLRRLADRSERPCRCEVTLFQEMLQAKVKRLEHIPDGGVACVYEIVDSSHSSAAMAGDQDSSASVGELSLAAD